MIDRPLNCVVGGASVVVTVTKLYSFPTEMNYFIVVRSCFLTSDLLVLFLFFNKQNQSIYALLKSLIKPKM